MNAIRECLDALLAACDAASTRARDPVDYVHRYTSQADREVVGLVASSLAFGNAVAARHSVERVLDMVGPEPASLVAGCSRQQLEQRLEGFVHRIYRGPHLARMLWHAGLMLNEHGSLGEAFAFHHRETRGDFRESLALFADRLRGETSERSARHLVSDPRAGSACKRLLLYARWMIRPADGVDLGLWCISPSELLIPVDTHVHRISVNLGLTDRRTASWATAQDITAALRELDPEDPVKYDFALCHLGVSRECPSRPDPEKCERCVLQSVCRVWTSSAPNASAKEARELRL